MSSYSVNRNTWQGSIHWDGAESEHALKSRIGEDAHLLQSDFTVNASNWRKDGYAPVSEILLILDRLDGQKDPATLLVSVSTRIIIETAKLWVLRRLLDRIHITTIGDPRDLAPHDGGTNRIRTTLQSVVGVWGGADEVCVLPHNVLERGFSDIDAARHALAVTRLLRHESQLTGKGRAPVGAEAIELQAEQILHQVEAWQGTGKPIADRLEEDRAWLNGPRRQQDENRVIVGVTQYN